MRAYLTFTGIIFFLILTGCVSNTNPPSPTNYLPTEPVVENEALGDTPLEEIQEDVPVDSMEGPAMLPSTPAVDPNTKPVLYNLGVTFGPWNKKTNKAGDFLFTKGLFDDKLFLESAAYVVGSNGPKLIPELTFHLPEGTKIISPVNGTIVSVQKMYSNDYAVNIQTTPDSQWLVTFEHMENLTVKEGQTIEIGVVLGEASTFTSVKGMAFTELVVWKGGSTEKDIIKLCPVPLLDSSVRAELEKEIIQLAQDWESFMGKNIYDEDEWFAPGCMREQLTEYEAMHPD